MTADIEAKARRQTRCGRYWMASLIFLKSVPVVAPAGP
jgi:hypothetical protein